jgi:UDP-N-acetyl-D-mannosaminuronic acid transferase (WecB/TagA/CpsF family)
MTKDKIETAEDMQFVYWLKKQCEYEIANPPIPDYIKDIAKTFNEAGKRIYLVGGATRSIVGGNIKLQEAIDWCDKTIAAWKNIHPDWKPEEIKHETST